MDCKQNNIITQLILASDDSETILKLLWDIKSIKPLEWLWEGIWALLHSKQKLLEAEIYAKFMIWENADLYKPVLWAKFIRWFDGSWMELQSRLQRLLINIQSWSIDDSPMMLIAKSLWVEDSLKTATDVVQKNLIYDYLVIEDESLMSDIKKAKQTWNISKKMQNNKLYKEFSNIHNFTYWRETYKWFDDLYNIDTWKIVKRIKKLSPALYSKSKSFIWTINNLIDNYWNWLKIELADMSYRNLLVKNSWYRLTHSVNMISKIDNVLSTLSSVSGRQWSLKSINNKSMIMGILEDELHNLKDMILIKYWNKEHGISILAEDYLHKWDRVRFKERVNKLSETWVSHDIIQSLENVEDAIKRLTPFMKRKVGLWDIDRIRIKMEEIRDRHIHIQSSEKYWKSWFVNKNTKWQYAGNWFDFESSPVLRLYDTYSDRVFLHEFSHHLEQFINKETVEDIHIYYNESLDKLANELYSKYNIWAFDVPWVPAEFTKISLEDLKKYIKTETTQMSWELTTQTQFRNNAIQELLTVALENEEDLYRYTNIHEFIAEELSDAFERNSVPKWILWKIYDFFMWLLWAKKQYFDSIASDFLSNKISNLPIDWNTSSDILDNITRTTKDDTIDSLSLYNAIKLWDVTSAVQITKAIWVKSNSRVSEVKKALSKVNNIENFDTLLLGNVWLIDESNVWLFIGKYKTLKSTSKFDNFLSMFTDEWEVIQWMEKQLIDVITVIGWWLWRWKKRLYEKWFTDTDMSIINWLPKRLQNNIDATMGEQEVVDVINKHLKDWKLNKEKSGQIFYFLKNYAESTITKPESRLWLLFTTSYWANNLKSLSDTVFLRLNMKDEWIWWAIIWAMSESYKKYSAKIWPVHTVEWVEDLKAYLHRNPNIRHIIIQNDWQVNSKEISELSSELNKVVSWNEKLYSFVFPKWKSKFGYYTENWDLFLWTNKLEDIESARYIAASNWRMTDVEDIQKSLTDWNIWAKFDEFLFKAFDDNTVAYIKDVLGIVDMKQFEDYIDMFSTIDGNSATYIWKLSDITITEQLVKNRLQDIWITKIPDSIQLTDDIQNAYLQATYWRTFADIAEWETVLWKMFDDTFASVDASDLDIYVNVIKTLTDEWFFPVFRREDMVSILSEIKAWRLDNVIEKARENNTNFLSRMVFVYPTLWTIDDFGWYINDIIKNTKPTPTPMQWEIWEFIVKRRISQLPDEIISKITKIKLKKKKSKLSTKTYKEEIESLLDEYEDVVNTRLHMLWDLDEIPFQEADVLKTEYRKRIREIELKLENDTLLENYSSAYLPIVYSKWDKWLFTDLMIDSRFRFWVSLDKTQAVLKESHKAIESGKLDDVLRKNWKIVYEDNTWKVRTITIADKIRATIANTPPYINLWWLKDTDFSLLSNDEAVKLLNDIESLVATVAKNEWIIDTFYRFDGNLHKAVQEYKNRTVSIVGKTKAETGDVLLPDFVTRHNSSQWVLDVNDDLVLKYRIYKKVSNAIKEWAVSWERIWQIVSEEVSLFTVWKELVTTDIVKWIIWTIDSYTQDFLIYSRLPKIEQEYINAMREIIENSDSIQRSTLLSSVTYKSTDWTHKLVTSQADIDYNKYPDIIWRENETLPINMVSWNSLDKEATKKNVTNLVNAQANNIAYNKAEDWHIIRTINNIANPIMDVSPRLRAIKWFINRVIDRGKMASWELHRAYWDITDIKLVAREAIWLWRWYNPDYIHNLFNSVQRFIKTPLEEFTVIELKSLNDLDRSAYMIANYFIDLRQFMAGITTEKWVNLKIVDEINNFFVWKTVINTEWIIEFTNGAEKFIWWLESSMSNGSIFYWLKAFEDEWIKYSAKTNMFWFVKEQEWASWVDRFDKLFNSSLSVNDYRVVMWALQWQYIESKALTKIGSVMNNIWSMITSPFMKLASSVPWSFITWISSAIWYMVWIRWYAKLLPDFWDFRNMGGYRKLLGILNTAWPDTSSLLWEKSLEVFISQNRQWYNSLSELYEWLQSLYSGNKYAWHTLLKQWFDNWQNLIDALFAHIYKDYATAFAMKNEWFISIKDFDDFIRNPDIDRSVREVIFDRVINTAYDLHESMINYVARWLTTNIKLNTPMWHIWQLVNMLVSPINFRWSLGTNMLINLWNKMLRFVDYTKTYVNSWFNSKYLDVLLADPILKMFTNTIINDLSLAFKLEQMQEQWNTIEWSEITPDDIMWMLWIMSQQWQFYEMSWPWRVISSAVNSDWNVLSAVLTTYSRNFLKQATSFASITKLWASYASWWPENFYSALKELVPQWSTAWLRYMSQETSQIIPDDSWLSPIFQWVNSFQQDMYNKSTAQTQWTIDWLIKSIKDWTFESNRMRDLIWEIVKMWAIGKMTLWNIADYNRWKSYVNTDEFTDWFNNSRIGNMYINNWFIHIPTFQNPKTLWVDWYVKQGDVIWDIMRSITLDFIPWQYDFSKLIEHYIDKWDTQRVDNWFTHYADEDLQYLLEDMNNKWVLDKLHQQIINNPQNNRSLTTQQTQFMVDYINWMDKSSFKAELLQAKLLATAEYYRYRYDYLKELKWDKSLRTYQNWKYKTYKPWEADEMSADIAFIGKYYHDVQAVASSERWMSWLWLDNAIKEYARTLWTDNELFFKLDKDWNPKDLKAWLKFALQNKYKMDSEIESGILPTTAALWIYWPYSLYAASYGWKDWFKYDKEANLEGVMYAIRRIKWQDVLTQEQKDYLTLQVAANIPHHAVDYDVLSERMWEDFVNDVKRTVVQSILKAGKLAHANVDEIVTEDLWAKWVSGSSVASSNKIAKISQSLKVLKEHAASNPSVWKVTQPRVENLDIYQIPRTTRGQVRLSPPVPPQYSASSKGIFKKSQTKKTTLKQVRQRVLSKKILSWK